MIRLIQGMSSLKTPYLIDVLGKDMNCSGPIDDTSLCESICKYIQYAYAHIYLSIIFYINCIN